MPVKRRRGRPPAHAAPGARDALLRAATSVFAARGYAGASVDRIAGAAGLSKGTFYWHFESKEDLFLTLIDERIDAPARALMTTRAPKVSQGLADLFTAERELLVLLQEYWAAAARDERVAKRYRARSEALVETLAAALAARHEETGVPLTTPPERLATAFVALAHGLSMEAAVNPDAVDAGLYGEVLSLVYDGLTVRAGQ
jgi:AcrR family transcriptional regulator